MKRLISKVAARLLSTTLVGDVGPFRGAASTWRSSASQCRRVLLRR